MSSDTARFLLLLLPLIVLQLALLAAALWDLVHRERVRGGNKWVWGIVIVLFNIIGPVVYFLFGREE
ncbi:MAG: PLD nuclease N-terminal domain-containing protein [Anaerolineae bacterium]|nr:PLD nuclease N-terminal domain-containing protein [Anaerolineae bacterium]